MPPQTRVVYTILDLTQIATSLEDAYAWLARGVNSRLTTVDKLLDAMTRRLYLRNRTLLRERLGGVAAGCRSGLELAYLRQVESAHGLPTGERQVPASLGGSGRPLDGAARIYLDVRHRGYRTREELDGRATHPFDERFRDMQRDNAGVLAGAAPLRYGTSDVTRRPCDVPREVADVLRGPASFLPPGMHHDHVGFMIAKHPCRYVGARKFRDHEAAWAKAA